MFSAKKLEKLVAAGIISPEQKSEILKFDDTTSGGFVMKALSLLAIFTIGIGVISMIASNWEAISDGVKLFVMFVVLFATAGGAVYYRQTGQTDKAENWLVGLFLFTGAAIGLVIQIYHLSGGKMHTPFGFWCLTTLPLLFAAKKKNIAYFWVSLFLAWCAMFFISFKAFRLERLLEVYALLVAVGFLLNKYVPNFVAGSVLKKQSFFAFYLVLAVYILWYSGERLLISAGILLATSFLYYHYQDYRKVRLNIKFAGLWVFGAYIYFGDEIGLFSTGLGLILSGVLLILLLKGVSKISKQIKGGQKNA